MTKISLKKKDKRTLEKEIKSGLSKDIQKSIDQKVYKATTAVSDTVYTVTEQRMNNMDKRFAFNNKILLAAGALITMVLVVVLIISSNRVEKRVKSEMAAFQESQLEILANYKQVLNAQLDSITRQHKEELYAKIEAEIKGDGFRDFAASLTQQRFDKIAPEMIEPLAKKYLEAIVMQIETKANTTLDSLEKEIIKKQSVLETNKSTAQVE